MTVGQLIEALSKFDPSLNLTISDGYKYNFYEGDFEIELVDNEVDIGVGGCHYREKQQEQ